MYLIEKNTELTEDMLSKILMQFQTKELPLYIKLDNYYQGKQKILHKMSKDESKKYNHIVVNYCYSIVQNYLGYLTGIPIQYDNENFEEIVDILKYNDYITEDSELLKQALIYGRAFEINYIDEEGKQRFRVLDTKSCIPVYDNTLNNELQYVIRFWREDLSENRTESYYVEVYGINSVKKYRASAGFTTFTFMDELPYYYNECPLTVFSLNDDEASIFSQIITLQDAYNEVISGSVDDFDAFCDAYLVLKGMQADEEDLLDMKKNRVLIMDTDCSAEYLTKSINDTQTLNLIKNFNDNIHKIANCPDFYDENFMTQSGVALRYKLVGFENTAASIEANMRKALQRRIELICTILKLTNDEQVWRDVRISFTRNLPTDLADTVEIVNKLKGLVSDRTLLSLLPFVTDVDKELADIEAQNQRNAELYSFSNDYTIKQEEDELLETERARRTN